MFITAKEKWYTYNYIKQRYYKKNSVENDEIKT